MADTTYADGTTPAVNADWLNDVNRLHYTILSDPADAAAVRTALNVEDGATADQSDSEIETAYNNQVTVVSQAEAEAGVATTVRRWTAQRVGQAVTALAPAGLSATNVLDWSTSDTLDSGDTSGYAHVIVWADASAGSFTVTLPSAANFNNALITVLADVDPGSNAVTVNNSAASEVATLYELNDYATFSSDGSTVRKLSEEVTINGRLRISTAETIGGSATSKVFDVNYAEEVDIGGWWDSSTNHRLDIGFDCILQINVQFRSEDNPDGLNPVLYINGSGEYSASVSNQVGISTSWVWQLSSGDYVEIYAANTSASSNNLRTESHLTWAVLRRLD